MKSMTTRVSKRRGLRLLLTCVLLASSSASSRYQNGRGYRRDPYRSTYTDDESSYYASDSYQDLMEEEERILFALERIDEVETPKRSNNRRKKTRSVESSTQRRRKTTKLEKNQIDLQERTNSKADIAANNRRRSNNNPGSTRRQEPSNASSSQIATENLPRRPRQSSKQERSSISSMNSSFEMSMRPGVPLTPHMAAAKPQSIPTRISTQPARKASTSTTTPWVRRYLSERPKDVLLPVPREYLSDGFNLAQLAPIVERIGFQVMGNDAVDIAKRLVELSPRQHSYPIYRLALQLLLNEDEANEAIILQHPLIPPHAIQQATEALYLMIHARFVASARGLDALRRILRNSSVFGKCPSVQCQGAPLLPYGASNGYDATPSRMCQRYCPCCGNVWNFWESKTDGCAWGPSLCHMLLLAHGSELYATTGHRRSQSGVGTVQSAAQPINPPTVLGFRIHPATTWGRPLNESW